MDQVSDAAKFWFDVFRRNPTIRINYMALMERGVPRRKSMDILRELKAAKLIIEKRSRMNGTKLELTKVSNLELTGSVSSDTAVQLVSYISNSYTASTASKVNKATYFLDDVEGEENEVGYDFFENKPSSDDEHIREREKHMAHKKAEYAAAREAKAQQRKDVHRSNVDPIHWNSKDVAYEFADRMANIWSIAPFSVTQSRFVQALGVFRKQHDTNGALELNMIEMFFSTLQSEKYTDGNHLWRAFLY